MAIIIGSFAIEIKKWWSIWTNYERFYELKIHSIQTHFIYNLMTCFIW